MQVSKNIPGGTAILGAYIGQYNNEIAKSMERLSSGLRVIRPSDDAGNYFKAKSLENRANQAMDVSRNLEEHLSRVKSTSDFLGTVEEMLNDLSSVAKEASEESNSGTRESLGAEFTNKLDSLKSFIESSRYDGALMLTGSYDTSAGGTAITAQIDEGYEDTYSYEILDTRTDSATGLNLAILTDAAARFKDGDGDPLAIGDYDSNGSAGNGLDYAKYYYDIIQGYDSENDEDTGLSRLKRNMYRLETHDTILSGAQRLLENKSANYEAAGSALVSVDDASESTNLAAMQLRQQAAASFLAQAQFSYSGVVKALSTAKVGNY